MGEWRGTRVAVKRIVLPADMSMSSRAEKMAVMEVVRESGDNRVMMCEIAVAESKSVTPPL